MDWFIQIGDEPKGPFSTEEVLEKLNSGDLKPGSLAFAKGQADWKEISQIPEFNHPKTESPPIMEEDVHPPIIQAGSPTSTETAQNVQVVETRQGNQTNAEIIAFTKLAGGDDLRVAKDIYSAYRSGLRLKQVRVDITQGELVIEAGCLHYMRGSLEVEAKSGGVGGWLKSAATGESTVKPRYRGSGLVHLEPTFGHFLFLDLQGEHWIVDQGMFYASEGSVEVDAVMQKNISSAIFGGEGLFQTELKGTGWAILASPVPPEEIVKITLNNDVLKVDGNFALARRGNIEFSVEKSAKSLWQSFRGGEGLLQTFRGTGEVWLAPTDSIYASLKESSGFSDLTDSEGSSGSKSGGSKVLGLLGD